MTELPINGMSKEVLRLRKAAGLSRNELARLAGVGKKTVFQVEHGKDTVQLDRLLKILDVVNLRMVLLSPMAPSKETS